MDINEKTVTHMDRNEANVILDRIIGLNGHCDNKASIILALYGIVAAIVFSSDVLTNIIQMIKEFIKFDVYCKGWMIFFLFISVGFIFAGIWCLVASLLPKTNGDKYVSKKEDSRSIIYFGDIANQYKTYKQYSKKMMKTQEDEYLNDICMEIYVNGKICCEKFNQFKQGVKLSLFGIAIFGLIFIIYMLAF